MKLQKRLTAESPLEVKRFYFMARCLKEALLYRSTELAETAIDLYRRNALVSAATITRSLLETTALFERLRETCAGFVNKHKKHGCHKDDFQKLDGSLRKISLGSTDQSAVDEKSLPVQQPYQVRSLVRSLATQYKFEAEEIYASLCQFAHPNFAGCIGPFAYWHDDHVKFISDYHLSPSPENATLFKRLLVGLLYIVESLRDDIEGLLPEFEKVCGEYFVE